jgi:hypothetical protein
MVSMAAATTDREITSGFTKPLPMGGSHSGTSDKGTYKVEYGSHAYCCKGGQDACGDYGSDSIRGICNAIEELSSQNQEYDGYKGIIHS